MNRKHIRSVAEQWSHDQLLERYADLYMAYNDSDAVKHDFINAEWTATRRYKVAEGKIKKFLTAFKGLGIVSTSKGE